MNKKLIRLTESDLHRFIKESVNEVLNEIGDSEKSHEYLGTISGYYEAQGNSDKANRAYNLSTRLQKNRNNGQLYDPNSEESASEYRRNSYAYTNGFDKGWDKGRRQMEEATADPRWWQKDGEFPDMKDTAYSKPKQQVKVSEAQLHQIVKESVEQALSEGFFDKFRRTANARDAYKGLDGDYSYSKDNDRFYYHDKYGNKHDTGIGYGKGNVGTNWNPFKIWNSGDRQVTQHDANRAKRRLQYFNDDSWGGRKEIDNKAKRAYDNEQERKRQEAWREQQRREEEEANRRRAEYEAERRATARQAERAAYEDYVNKQQWMR